MGLAWVALGRGRAEQATVLLGAAQATRERIGATPTGAEQAEAELALDAAHSRLDADAVQAALTSGHGLATEQALRVVLAWLSQSEAGAARARAGRTRARSFPTARVVLDLGLYGRTHNSFQA